MSHYRKKEDEMKPKRQASKKDNTRCGINWYPISKVNKPKKENNIFSNLLLCCLHKWMSTVYHKNMGQNAASG